MKDGPIVIKRQFELINAGNNKVISGSIISICRCGKSHQMPFCDGHHKKWVLKDDFCLTDTCFWLLVV